MKKVLLAAAIVVAPVGGASAEEHINHQCLDKHDNFIANKVPPGDGILNSLCLKTTG
jgi:hypothetical protein